MLVTLLAFASCAAAPQITEEAPSTLLNLLAANGTDSQIIDLLPTGDGGAYFAGLTQLGSSSQSIVGRMSASGTILWTRTSDLLPPPLDTVGVGIASDGAGGVIAVTNTSDVFLLGDASVVERFGPDGAFLAGVSLGVEAFPQPTIPTNSAPRTVVSDGNGGAYVAVRRQTASSSGEPGATIYHIPAAFDPVVVATPFALDAVTIVALAPTSDGGLLAVLQTAPAEYEAARLDATLNLVWQVDLPTPPFFNVPRTIAEGADGGVYIGIDTLIGPNLFDLGDEIRKLDGQSGSPIWTEPLLQDGALRTLTDLVPLPDGGIMIAGRARVGLLGQQAFLRECSADGELGATQLYGATDEQTEIHAIVREDGRWLAAGMSTSADLIGMFPSAFIAGFDDAGDIGLAYCGPAVANSTGVPGVTRAFGSTAMADNNVVLRSFDLPAGAFGLYVLGSEQGVMPILGGSNGRLCIAGNLGRVATSLGRAALDGTTTHVLDLSSLPTSQGTVQVMAGDTWNFQFWHRDDPSVSNSNATDAVSITFD